MPTQDARFAVATDEGRRTPYWHVRMNPRGDVFVRRARTGPWMHASLFDGASWHMKTVIGNEVEQMDWEPPEVIPGVTRLFEISVHEAMATTYETKHEVTTVGAPGPERWTHFDLWTAKGQPADSWPAKRAMGTDLVARLPMPNEHELIITSYVNAFEPPAPAHAKATPEELEKLRKALKAPGNVGGFAFVRLDDGTVAVVDAPITLTLRD